ncbi:MAG TPA: nucleotidyltransferase family protein [Sphingomicrobium sp.]|nr:nucleotidyltransferase family protein [Sphingomicrobium sp.]
MSLIHSAFRPLLNNLTGTFDPPEDWQPMLQLASDSLTIGSLASAVLKQPEAAGVPEEVSALLEDVLKRTKKRNRRLKRQFSELLPALNAIGVQPIVMRGMASLLGSRPDPGRLLSDIDLLVPVQSRQACVDVMRSLGYQLFQGFHGAPFSAVLGRASDVGMVDLHTDIQPYVLEVNYDRLAPLCRPKELPAGQVILPNPTCSLLLLILHDQLHDGDYWRGLIDVRHLVESPRLVRSRVDWETLAGFFPEGAPRNAMYMHLRTAKSLLHLDIPEKYCGETWIRLQLRRRLLQLRVPALMTLLTFLTALVDRPLRAAKSNRSNRSATRTFQFRLGRALRPVNAGKI